MTRIRIHPSIQPNGPLRAVMAAALAAGPATTAAACSEPQAVQPQEVTVACVERATMNRVDDIYCPTWDEDLEDDDRYFAYFSPSSSTVHPVGAKVSGGSHRRPAGHFTVVKAPPAGRAPYSVPGGPAAKPGGAPPANGGFGGSNNGSTGG